MRVGPPPGTPAPRPQLEGAAPTQADGDLPAPAGSSSVHPSAFCQGHVSSADTAPLPFWVPPWPGAGWAQQRHPGVGLASVGGSPSLHQRTHATPLAIAPTPVFVGHHLPPAYLSTFIAIPQAGALQTTLKGWRVCGLPGPRAVTATPLHCSANAAPAIRGLVGVAVCQQVEALVCSPCPGPHAAALPRSLWWPSSDPRFQFQL